MAHSIAMWITNYSSEYTLHMILIREYRKRSGKTKRDNVTCDNVTTHYALGVVTPFVFFLANTKQAKRHVVTLSRCHVFKKWTRGIGIQRIVYINIYLYILFFEHFSPPHGGSKTKTWQRDNVTMWQRTKPSSSPTHPTTNNAKSYKPIIYTICDSYLQLFNPCPLVTFYSCQRRLHTLLLPSLLAKKLEKREEIPKKMRNFVGSFDCIDKLKYPLRQPFEQ